MAIYRYIQIVYRYIFTTYIVGIVCGEAIRYYAMLRMSIIAYRNKVIVLNFDTLVKIKPVKFYLSGTGAWSSVKI